MKKIKNILLYAGVERSKFESIKGDLRESSRKNMILFTLIAVIALTVMLFMSLFDASLVKNRLVYIISAVLCLFLLYVVGIPAKKNPHLIIPAIYTFTGVLFAFGILLGTFIEPNETTVSFPILLFAVPLLFTDRPLRMNLAIIVGMAVYFLLAAYTQNATYFGYNLSNVLPYGILSLVVSTFMMYIKIERLVLVQENRFLSEYDQLTGLKNRRSYERHLLLLQEKVPSGHVLLCAMDVNGLKNVNDHLGHSAGDDLLKGAAECIETVFGPFGSCYRTGGDEFAAILDHTDCSPEELTRMLNDCTDRRKGKAVSDLSISLGIVSLDPNLPVSENVNRADKEMYRSKAAYYAAIERDRRHTDCKSEK